MSENVVSLRAKSRAEIIQVLRDLITCAETNKGFSLVLCASYDDGGHFCWSGIEIDQAVGMAARLTHNLNRVWDEEGYYAE